MVTHCSMPPTGTKPSSEILEPGLHVGDALLAGEGEETNDPATKPAAIHNHLFINGQTMSVVLSWQN